MQERPAEPRQLDDGFLAARGCVQSEVRHRFHAVYDSNSAVLGLDIEPTPCTEEALELGIRVYLAGNSTRIRGRMHAQPGSLEAVLPDVVRPGAEPAFGAHAFFGIVEVHAEDVGAAAIVDLVVQGETAIDHPPGHLPQRAIVFSS